MTRVTAQVGPITVNPPPPPPGPLVRRFGFSFVSVGGSLSQGYTADTLFDGMFLTPPYPSTLHLGSWDGTGIFQLTPGTNPLNFALRVFDRASAYPNIKIGLALAWNVRLESEWLKFETFLNTLDTPARRNSVGFIGFSYEQLGHIIAGYGSVVGERVLHLDRMKTLIESHGWQLISYYPGAFSGTGRANYGWLYHTNYPQADNQATLNQGIAPEIFGITVGTDGGILFPSPACASNGFPRWSIQAFPNGFTDPNYPPPIYVACFNSLDANGWPPTIRQFLDRARANPLQNRQWNFIIAGNSRTNHGDTQPTLNFIGVSGRSTNQLWDHPTFRQEIQTWINENPGWLLQGAI